MRHSIVVAAALVSTLHPSSASGQASATIRPRLQNGTVQERSAAAGLATALRDVSARPGIVWVGYAVPSVAGEHDMCCWNDTRHGPTACRLEPEESTRTVGASPLRPTVVPLEAERHLLVLLRYEQGRLERVRTFTPTCTLDAGGHVLTWLTGVRPAESVAVLTSALSSAPALSLSKGRLEDGVLGALAMHDDSRALDWLLTAARSHDSSRVRGQSLFWLSQRAGERAVGAIADAVDRDPDTDVKRKAVFALGQLPAEDGVPRLIALARTHSNRAVRKDAFFWLGQSKDPRALAFFREVLTR